MADTTITGLPIAQTVNQTDLVPIVQDGTTKQATIAQVQSVSPTTAYDYVTLTNDVQLPNSRVLNANHGLTVLDGGPGSNVTVTTQDTLRSLADSTSSGILVSDTGTSVAHRTLVSPSAGITITNADGVAGNPTFVLADGLASIENLLGYGLVATNGTDSFIHSAVYPGSAITVTNGDGRTGNITVAVTDNPTIPGTASMVVPSGTTVQRPMSSPAMFRFNKDSNVLEYVDNNGNWVQLITVTTSMSNVLPSGYVFVGNNLGIATPTAITGDLAITNTGATTVSHYNGGTAFGDMAGQSSSSVSITGGTAALTTASAGPLGTEATTVNINGATYSSTFKVSDIGGATYNLSQFHRHSTTLESFIIGTRSNSDTATHASVTNGQNVFTVFGAGTAGANYKLFGSINIGVDGSGTVNNTSAPGRIQFNVTADGAVNPSSAMVIHNDGSVAITSASVTFNGVQAQTTALPSGNIRVGNGSGVATAVAVSGDVAIDNTGSTTVSKIGGKAISIANSFTMSGNYTFTGTLSNNTAVTFPTSGTLLTNALTSAYIFVGNGSAVATGVAVSGDISIDNTGLTAIGSNKVTYAKFQQIAASSLVGNATAGLANATGITLGAALTFSGSALQTVALSGDVTSSANSFATTIGNNAVTNAKAAQMAALTVKGNNTTGTANAADLTVDQFVAMAAQVERVARTWYN